MIGLMVCRRSISYEKDGESATRDPFMLLSLFINLFLLRSSLGFLEWVGHFK